MMACYQRATRPVEPVEPEQTARVSQAETETAQLSEEEVVVVAHLQTAAEQDPRAKLLPIRMEATVEMVEDLTEPKTDPVVAVVRV